MDWVRLYTTAYFAGLLLLTGSVVAELTAQKGGGYYLPAAIVLATQVPMMGRIFGWW